MRAEEEKAAAFIDEYEALCRKHDMTVDLDIENLPMLVIGRGELHLRRHIRSLRESELGEPIR